jgi:hypothetical protein
MAWTIEPWEKHGASLEGDPGGRTSTGIIDSRQYMPALLGDMTRWSPRDAIQREGENWLRLTSGDEEITLRAAGGQCASLWAQSLASRIGLKDVPPLILAKGNYAGLSVKSPFRHLVYPVPEPGGLGCM